MKLDLCNGQSNSKLLIITFSYTFNECDAVVWAEISCEQNEENLLIAKTAALYVGQIQIKYKTK